jgi:hypothetical protein
MEDLPINTTGVHLTAEEFLEVDAEEPVFSEMTIKETVHLMRNDLGVTDSESEDDDPRDGEKMTSKESQMCVEKILKKSEKNSITKGVIRYNVALNTAIGKINEKKKVQPSISVYFVPKNEITVKTATV